MGQNLQEIASQKPDPEMEKEFGSLAFGRNRSAILCAEMAKKIRASKQHIIDLCEEGKIPGAIDISAGTGRKNYRIPITAYYEFLRVNRTVPPVSTPDDRQQNLL
jgi:hypothetical protein